MSRNFTFIKLVLSNCMPRAIRFPKRCTFLKFQIEFALRYSPSRIISVIIKLLNSFIEGTITRR